jgi:diadenosine tetraphosphate (Ap4A) HIT family hydrolase
MTAACDLCTLAAALDTNSAVVWHDEQLAVVLVEEAGYPGFCRVVWRAHVREMTDLTAAERDHVMQTVWTVEQALRDTMAPHKVNVASFGNMTPHVHWHVIPRYADDAHFPQPTWGQQQRPFDPASLAVRAAQLPQLRAAIIEKLRH